MQNKDPKMADAGDEDLVEVTPGYKAPAKGNVLTITYHLFIVNRDGDMQ